MSGTRTERDDRIIVSAPVKGACPVCAVKHAPDEPHETRSLYYIMRYARREGRLPTGDQDDGR